MVKENGSDEFCANISSGLSTIGRNTNCSASSTTSSLTGVKVTQTSAPTAELWGNDRLFPDIMKSATSKERDRVFIDERSYAI